MSFLISNGHVYSCNSDKDAKVNTLLISVIISSDLCQGQSPSSGIQGLLYGPGSAEIPEVFWCNLSLVRYPVWLNLISRGEFLKKSDPLGFLFPNIDK